MTLLAPLLCACLWNPSPVRAEDSFLGLPFGARALAMGSAYTAVADDAQAAWWNPAGLAQVGRASVAGSQNHLSFTDNSYALAGTVPAGRLGSFAVSAQHLAIENAALTRPVLDANGNPVLDPASGQPLVEITGFGQENDATFMLGYGVEIMDGLLLGGTGKVLVGHAGRVLGTGTGADAGLLAVLPGGWRVGLVGEDLGNSVVRWRDATRTVLAPAARLGVSWAPWKDLLVSVEGASPFDRLKATQGAGLEWRFAESIAFRAGESDGHVTGGVGFRMSVGTSGGAAVADYAFVTGGRFEDHNRLTLGVTF